ncbi:MAG: hypothetical protein PHU23_06050 [Dehalococcoidales bacterium]|nr:hypothetical protein [Dehalococcoidales bacterium]
MKNNNQEYNRYRCSVVLPEYVSASGEIPDVIGFRGDYSVLIECKVSREDFKADQNKPHRDHFSGVGMGNYRFYLVQSGLITAEELPEGWGLLYAHPKTISINKHPEFDSNPMVKVHEYKILYSLVRRAEIRGLIPSLREPLAQEEK